MNPRRLLVIGVVALVLGAASSFFVYQRLQAKMAPPKVGVDVVVETVCKSSATPAMDALEKGTSGWMTAIDEGRYAMVPIPDPKLGPRNVEVAAM
jgi:hypothetical protein